MKKKELRIYYYYYTTLYYYYYYYYTIIINDELRFKLVSKNVLFNSIKHQLFKRMDVKELKH